MPVSENSSLQEYVWLLKQQHPNCSLIAEFITYAASEYAVRAFVQVDDRILSTGMAAASKLEEAEDRAKVRAIKALGVENREQHELLPAAASFSPSEPSPSKPSQAAASVLPLPRSKPAKPVKPLQLSSLASPDTSLASQTANEQATSVEELPPASLSSSEAEPSLLASQDIVASAEDPSIPKSGPNLNSSPQPHIESMADSGEGVAASSHINLVDAIAKTSVEMQRLGWNINQGREHLLASYGKRSRGELTDDELLDFLQFLEKQPNA